MWRREFDATLVRGLTEIRLVADDDRPIVTWSGWKSVWREALDDNYQWQIPSRGGESSLNY